MKSKLFRSTFVFSAMTLISRVLGLVRDLLLAITFGAGPAFDAFVIAFKIPNFMRRLFAEGAFSQAFVPVLSEYRANYSAFELRAFLDNLSGCFSSALFLVIVLGEILAPGIIIVFAPGFVHDPIRFHTAVHLLRLMAPYLFLIGLTAFSSAILNTFNRFGVSAFSPVLLNVAMITVVLLWVPYVHVPIDALAWGVLIGGVVQLLFQLPFLYRARLIPRPSWHWRHAGVVRVLKLMIPALFGVSVAQISLLIDNLFASFLPAGSLSWLYYSDRLTYLPLGLIGVALATVVLPNLSYSHHQASVKQYTRILDWAIKMAMFVGIPAAVGLLVLAGPLLATLIYHGAFTANDVVMTRRSLWAFSVGLPGFMLVKLLASAFYARQDIKTPVRVAMVAVLVNLVFNVFLIHSLAHAGLALATSIAAFVNAGLLLVCLMKRAIYQTEENWWKWLGIWLLANGVMAGVTGWLAGGLTQWLQWSIWERIAHLSGIISVGILVYVIMLWLLGLRMADLTPPLES